MGCGGTQLKPEQEKEYAELGQKIHELKGELRAIQSESQARFTRLTKLEKKAGIASSKTVICGARLSGQHLGPIPFRYKTKYRVTIRGKKKASVKGRSCVKPSLKVGK